MFFSVELWLNEMNFEIHHKKLYLYVSLPVRALISWILFVSDCSIESICKSTGLFSWFWHTLFNLNHWYVLDQAPLTYYDLYVCEPLCHFSAFNFLFLHTLFGKQDIYCLLGSNSVTLQTSDPSPTHIWKSPFWLYNFC